MSIINSDWKIADKGKILKANKGFKRLFFLLSINKAYVKPNEKNQPL
jgi:hypothetical protein